MSWMLHISESYPTGRYFSSPWKSSCHKAHSGSFSVSMPRFRKISPLLVQPLISLLMVLGGDFPNDSQLFQDVVGGCHTSIVGFYGTSGAGKTRTIFEIFTRSYGLYFVAADARTLNPGSNDLRSNYAVLGRFKDEATPRECDDYVRVYTTAMILCRLLVFCVLRHAFGEELSCELWLRVQLAPTHYFRHDVFDSLFSKFISKSSTGVTDATQLSERLNLLEPYLDLIWENLNDSLDTITFNVAFDEAQVLANMFNNFLKSSIERGETRSLLSPISKALSKLLSNSQCHLLHPIFSGTGFSVAHIITQLSSATGKRTLADTLHYNFKSLEEGNVKTYLESILDLSQLDERILQYTCRWLTGRPRWTVAFVDLLLARDHGEIIDLDAMFLEEIRSFDAVMTRPDAFGNASRTERESRLSWRYGKTSTAQTAIKRIKDDNTADRLNKVKEALVIHLFTDQSAPLSGEFTPELVNVGLCQVSTVAHGR